MLQSSRSLLLQPYRYPLPCYLGLRGRSSSWQRCRLIEATVFNHWNQAREKNMPHHPNSHHNHTCLTVCRLRLKNSRHHCCNGPHAEKLPWLSSKRGAIIVIVDEHVGGIKKEKRVRAIDLLSQGRRAPLAEPSDSFEGRGHVPNQVRPT